MYSSASPLTRIVFVVFIFFILFIVFYGAQPPKALPSDSNPELFSGQRALELNNEFAFEPRPRGGDAAAKGRDYLVEKLTEYGVEVEIQRDPINFGTSISFAENVMARISGTDSKQTFAITAHYDSVAWGPGAADDASGVVVMLETARALMSGPSLKNDVVFIFTGDEEGGGNASVNSLSHRWLKDLNVMLGLEGRGAWGTAFMFETSKGNLPLMYELAKSGAPAVSNSIMYEVHSQTPNTTDFTHMTKRGALGYNVAFVGGLGYYHTANDKSEYVSPRTLQHQGEYVLSLVRHYDDGGPKIQKGEDAVFFNTIGNHLIVYPASHQIYYTGLAITVFTIVLIAGLLTKSISVFSMIMSLILMGMSISLTAGIGWGLQLISYKLFYVYIMYNAAYYHISFFLLATAISITLLYLFRNKLTSESFYAAFLLSTLGVLIVVQLKIPIAGYSSSWPLFFGAIGLSIVIALKKFGYPSAISILILTLSALPFIAFIVPGMHALYHMGGALTPAANSVLFLSLFFAVTPAIILVIGDAANKTALVSFILAVIIFFCGWGAQRYTSDKPKMNSLSYALNLDLQKAIWLTSDKEPDEWVSQFIPADNQRPEDHANVLPGNHQDYLYASAPIAEIEPSKLTMLEDNTTDGKRNIVLKYTFTRSINEARFNIPGSERVISASVDGVGDVIADMSGWALNVSYLPPGKEMVLRLTLDATIKNPLRINVRELTFSLPDLDKLGYKQRPDWMIPKPNTLDFWQNNRMSSHQTYLIKTYEF